MRKKFQGKIVSAKTPKTLIVEIERMKIHPKYKRRYKSHKRYKVHYDDGEFNIGEKVIIEECRPISKDKNWKIVKKV